MIETNKVRVIFECKTTKMLQMFSILHEMMRRSNIMSWTIVASKVMKSKNINLLSDVMSHKKK